MLQPQDELPPDGGHPLAVRRACWRPRAGSTPTRRPPPTPTWTSSASGSFTGKGIYDVDAFEAATGETFPENQILSHDLIEGNYARCGLLSDTELFDDFPARYHAYARREHRWVRGDWQLLPWLGRRVPTADGARAPTRCRSWSGGSCSTTSAAAWCRPRCVVAAGAGLDGAPRLALALDGGGPGGAGVAAVPAVWRSLIGGIRCGSLSPLKRWRDDAAGDGSARSCSRSSFLADQARLLLDAIGAHARAAFRHARQAAGMGDRRLDRAAARDRPADFIRDMWPAPALAIALGVLVSPCCAPDGAGRGVAVPGRVAALAGASPTGSAGRGRSPNAADRRRAPSAAAGRAQDLACSSRRSSATTTTGSRPTTSRRIPDGRIAHRTSPTNMGLLAARRRCRPTTWATSACGGWSSGWRRRSRRSTGWRSTGATSTTGTRRETLQPLPPAYISTVDSGNLLGCLMALEQGCGRRP